MPPPYGVNYYNTKNSSNSNRIMIKTNINTHNLNNGRWTHLTCSNNKFNKIKSNTILSKQDAVIKPHNKHNTPLNNLQII